MKLETFDDVRKSIDKNSDREFQLLLGNGFSMAYDSDIFSYNALHDFVTALDDEDLTTIFSVVKTRNFEVIMSQLDNFLAILDALGGDEMLKKRLANASKKLKHSLLEAVKELHPEHVFKIPEDQSKSCSQFIKLFLDTGGSVYSTNYDLLLYWVLMRSEIIDHVDGCGREVLNPEEPSDEHEYSDLFWGKNKARQNVFYLHGALPFFDTGTTIEKEKYSVYSYLLENISERMEKGEYPIFVTAGNSSQKLEHIKHNPYLNYCYESLCDAKGSLVSFGFNFGEYDRHIIDAINKAAKHGRKVSNRLWSVYIGVYSDADRQHIESIADDFACKVRIFDASTVPLWS